MPRRQLGDSCSKREPAVRRLPGGVLLDRLDLAPAPGMRVLDAGCGPGRLAIPAARRVGPGGEVVALG